MTAEIQTTHVLSTQWPRWLMTKNYDLRSSPLDGKTWLNGSKKLMPTSFLILEMKQQFSQLS